MAPGRRSFASPASRDRAAVESRSDGPALLQLIIATPCRVPSILIVFVCSKASRRSSAGDTSELAWFRHSDSRLERALPWSHPHR
jgi:hypothetical protein